FLELVEQATEAEFPAPAELLIQPEIAGASNPMRDRAKSLPYRLEALSCYKVLEQDDWGGRLEIGLLGPEQVARIRRAAYEQLLLLADDSLRRRVDHRSGKQLSPPEAAQQTLAYLGRAETAFRLTPAFFFVRGVCRKALGEEGPARQDAELGRRMPGAVALDCYIRALTAFDARN